MKLYLATSNAGKVREFLGAGLEVELLPGLKDLEVPEESGQSFEENAILKALYYARHSSGVVIAEDSGLEVDALGGAPGIHSARWAGDDDSNNRKLVAELATHENRRARYRCVIALVRGAEVLGTFDGAVEGEILREPKGSGGFGYDPYFYYPPFGQTFAELAKERKAEVSHRGEAIRKLSAFLNRSASR
jgi:XTP/dITP diphosphohydrolase